MLTRKLILSILAGAAIARPPASATITKPITTASVGDSTDIISNAVVSTFGDDIVAALQNRMADILDIDDQLTTVSAAAEDKPAENGNENSTLCFSNLIPGNEYSTGDEDAYFLVESDSSAQSAEECQSRCQEIPDCYMFDFSTVKGNKYCRFRNESQVAKALELSFTPSTTDDSTEPNDETTSKATICSNVPKLCELLGNYCEPKVLGSCIWFSQNHTTGPQHCVSDDNWIIQEIVKRRVTDVTTLSTTPMPLVETDPTNKGIPQNLDPFILEDDLYDFKVAGGAVGMAAIGGGALYGLHKLQRAVANRQRSNGTTSASVDLDEAQRDQMMEIDESNIL